MINKYAFTLVEIIIVICVISVLISISVPRFRSSNKHVILKQTIETISSQIQYAKKISILTGKQIKIIINDEKKEIIIKGFDDIKKRSNFNIPDVFSLISDPKEIKFKPNGECDNYKITIKDLENEISCQCLDFTGEPQIIEK